MRYKIGDNILQISNGIFIRFGIIINKSDTEYELKWLNKGTHVKNLSTIRKYPFSFIENNELFDLINNDNMYFVIKKYVLDDDYETCVWIRDNLLNNKL